MAVTEGLLIGPAVLIGLIIGIVELFFLARDEPGMWLSHGFHALPVMMLFVFASMNVSFVLSLIPHSFAENAMVDLGIRVVIGLLAAIKTGAAAALVPHTSVGESKIHLLIIGGLVVAAPYVWMLVAGPLEPLLSGIPLF